MEGKTRPNRFTVVLGEDVDMAFKKLASEILKDGALTLKEASYHWHVQLQLSVIPVLKPIKTGFEGRS